MSDAAPIKKVVARKSRTAAGSPGQLDRFDDGTWEFFGNDKSSATDVAENIIGYEKREGNPDYERIKADTLAQLLLDTPENKLLKKSVGGDIKRPIPKNQSFLAEGSTLKQLVGMLMTHEKALREQLIQQDAGANADKTSQVIGNVRGGGLTLPYEPS